MAGKDNLRVPTSEEARENGRKGGIASGKARREKKQLRECLEELLDRVYQSDDGQQMTGAELISARLFLNARSGDNKAYEMIRDTTGQKPVERIEATLIPPEKYEQVAQALIIDDEDTEQSA